MDVFVCHSTLGTSTVYFKTLHLLWGWVQGSCVSRLVGSHRVLLVPLGVLGGELLPAAPLQPCAGAPSGRGHTIFWTVLTWPQDIMPASMSALQYRHEAPPRHGAMCRGPSSGGLSGRWVLSEPCQYLPCPILATNLVVCYAPLLEKGFEACLDRLKMSRTGYFSFHSAFWAGNCCLRHPFSPVLEPRQGGDIRYSGLC